jgi:phage terminase large subunit-like protein
MIVKTNGVTEEYAAAMKAGDILVCESIRQIYDRLCDDMHSDRYIYDTTEADRRIRFMEQCIKLTKSPFYGKPMQLMLFQKAFISAFYGFKMAEDGIDRFRKALLMLSRKGGKSEFCSGLSLSELVLGNAGSDIVCSSNNDVQASILYDAIDTMRLMIDPQQLDTWRNQRFIRNKITDSKIFKLSERTRNKEGRNIDFAVIDECHEMRENTIIKSIEQSMSLKINPKLIMITTEGFVNEGFLDDELRRARAIISGEEDGISAERYLPLIYEQDSEQEVWQDRQSWIKSNPSLGILKPWRYLDEQVDAARQSKSERVFVLAKDFNVKQSNAAAWLEESDYKYDATFDLEDFRNAICLGAVDLAETTDLICMKILFMRPNDSTKYIHTRYFIPEMKLEHSPDESAGAKYAEWAEEGYLTIVPGNDVDLSVVADAFYELYEGYGIRPLVVGYDQRFAKQFLKQMDYYGFDVEMVNQNADTMSNAIKLVEADLQAQRLNFQNHPIDHWCLGNASIRVNAIGQALIVKPHERASYRIDGAVCFAILQEIYRRYRSEFNMAIV